MCLTEIFFFFIQFPRVSVRRPFFKTRLSVIVSVLFFFVFNSFIPQNITRKDDRVLRSAVRRFSIAVRANPVEERISFFNGLVQKRIIGFIIGKYIYIYINICHNNDRKRPYAEPTDYKILRPDI